MTAAGERSAEIVILTPEGVRFGLPLAGPMTRFLAWLVDILAIFAILSFTLEIVNLFASVSKDFTAALATLFYFSISVGYAMFFEWLWNGQTPGKRVMRLRVVDTRGLKLEVSQIVIRNSLRAVDALPVLYFVGGVSMLVTKASQRLGDLAAGTAVVRLGSGMLFDAAPLAFGKYNSLLAHPHLVAKLRHKAPPALVHLASDALARRDEMAPEFREELFEELAGRFRALVAFPEDAWQGLTGEQYVRDALQAILVTRGLVRKHSID